jgi:hypothetical protein
MFVSSDYSGATSFAQITLDFALTFYNIDFPLKMEGTFCLQMLAGSNQLFAAFRK